MRKKNLTSVNWELKARCELKCHTLHTGEQITATRNKEDKSLND